MARYDLAGRAALVTGAARGIGLETARALHRRGCSVAVCDLDRDSAARASAAIGDDALPLAADVTDRSAMEDAVRLAVERFGGLDVVIANAGVTPPTATMRVIDPQTFERTIEIDLLGVWRTVRPALPHVAARRGQVLVISSAYAWMNGAANAAYAISKAGVEQLGRSLRVELAPHGASATVAHFGFVDTGLATGVRADPVGEELRALLPPFARRPMTAQRAADLLVWALEHRAPRVVSPWWWRISYALRGTLNPLLDRAVASRPRVLDLMRRADADERSVLRLGADPPDGLASGRSRRG